MGFTPAFQNILDECEQLARKTPDPKVVQKHFFDACVKIGPYERLCNLYRVRPKDPIPGEPSRLQFFYPNLMQQTFWHNRTNRDLVLKMRQGGVTTFSCLIALDMSLFNHGVNTAIMAHVQPAVKKFFKIIKTAFKAFQKDWTSYYPVASPPVDNVAELQISETGSTLVVCTEAKGLTLDFLHISEAAFILEDEKISESIEAVPFGGWVIMETTPDSASGYFWELWNLWEKKENWTFKGHFFEWWYQYPEKSTIPFLIPDEKFKYTDEEEVLMKKHDILTQVHILWRRRKIAEVFGDVGEFMRKYPEDSRTCFLSGASCVFSAGTMNALWKQEKDPPFVGGLTLEKSSNMGIS